MPVIGSLPVYVYTNILSSFDLPSFFGWGAG